MENGKWKMISGKFLRRGFLHSSARCPCRLLLSRYDLRPSGAHLFKRTFAVTGLQLNWSHRVLENFDCEAVFQTVEHGVLYAVIGGKTADPKFVHTQAAQLQRQISPVKRRVAILVAESFRDGADVNVVDQIRMKLCAFRVLHTMDRPGPAKVCKVFCAGRVPIATLEYRFTAFEKLRD